MKIIHRHSAAIAIAGMLSLGLWVVWPGAAVTEIAPSVPGSVVSNPGRAPEARRLPAAAAASSPAQPSAAGEARAFGEWTERYVASAAGSRPALVEEGRRLAAARREKMAELIRTDPRAALAAAVPMVVRQQLPAEVTGLLEERISGRGALALIAGTPPPGGTVVESTFRTAAVDGREYRAHVFGRREIPATLTSTSLHGIALDGHMAVAESPLRVLERGEIAAARPLDTMCGISGRETPVGPATPLNTDELTAVEYNGVVHVLCGAAHVAEIEARLQSTEETAAEPAAADGPGSSGVKWRPAFAWTHGPKKLLIMRVDFSDLPGTPRDVTTGQLITDDFAASVVGTIQGFYAENSVGQTALQFGAAINGDSPDVSPVLRMSQPSTYYLGNNGARFWQLHEEARALSAAAGINVESYDRIGVVFSWNSGLWWAGSATVTDRFFWINGYFDLRVVAHEIGHNYGLLHSSYWQPVDGDPVSRFSYSVEYGDATDVMGSGSYANYHFSHWHKSIAQWIPDSAVTTVETPGIYRIHRFDGPSTDFANARALKIKRDELRDFWIGYRAGIPLGTLPNGAYVLWGYQSNDNGRLLNVSRRTSNSSYESPLPVGESFTDTFSGVTMRTVAQGGAAPDQWLDVEIGFLPRVQWSRLDGYPVAEQDGSVTLRVVRAGGTDSAASVSYTTINETAVAGGDYTTVTGTLSWAAGDASERVVTIPILNDTVSEGLERFMVRLQNATGAVVGGYADAYVSIADAGSRDSSFVPDTPVGTVRDVLMLPDGSMVVGGSFNHVRDQGQVDHVSRGLARLTAEGRFVPEFTLGGGISANGTVHDLARQPDGRFLVAGEFATIHGVAKSNFVRLLADGSVDSSFNVTVNGVVTAVVAQPDGRILIGGHFTTVNGAAREYLARLQADGTLDPTFVGPNFDGSSGWQVRTLALQPDGRILVGGSFTLFNGSGLFRAGLCRVLANGALDPSLVMAQGAHVAGQPSQLRTVHTVAVLPDGRILIGGDFTAYNNLSRGRIARLAADGTVDAGFAPALDGPCHALLALPGDRLVVGGLFNTVNGVAMSNLARLAPDGTLAPDASGYTGFPGEVHGLQLTSSGRVQFCGFFNPFQDSTDWRPIWRIISGLPNLPGIVQFANGTVSGTEGTNVILTVSRTGGSGGAVTVGYASAPGTATAADYTSVAGALTWSDGETGAKTITVSLGGDTAAESAETFTLNLGAPVLGGLSLGAVQQCTVTIESGSLPPGVWQTGDIGAVGVAGSSSESGGVVTVSGSGADIWGTADAFHFRSQTLTGDGAIVARVASLGNTHGWAKAGLMFREDLAPGSREVMAFVTPGHHAGLQYRLAPGADTALGADVWAQAPLWLMLVRSGNTFGAYRSNDGNEWILLNTINCVLPATAHVGLAVSSHINSAAITATFDNVEIIPAGPPTEPPAAPGNLQAGGATASTVTLTWTDRASNETGFSVERAPGSGGVFAEVGTAGANATTFMDTGLTANTTYTYRIRARRDTAYSAYSNTALITTTSQPPSGWQGLDIGNVGPAGTDDISANPNISVQAGGADIWTAADGFRFVYQAWRGDGEIKARVARLDNTHPWAKAGVMFRETLAAGARNVAYVVTAAAGSGVQARAAAGAETTYTAGTWVSAPYWVRLVRSGNAFTASISADGVTWTAQGTHTVAMGADIYVGLAVSSHTTTTRTTAVFESVELPTAPPPPPPPADWMQTAWGAGSGSFANPDSSSVTVTATGADIWGQVDDGLFVQRAWSGDGEIVTRVESLTNTHPWAKAGVMFRESLAATSPNVFVGLTPAAGAVFQARATSGGPTSEPGHSWVPGAPSWLRLTRAGDTFTAAFSTNGTAWTALGSQTLVMPRDIFLGLGVSSHAPTATTAVFKEIQLPTTPPPPPPPTWTRTTLGAGSGSFTNPTTATLNVSAVGADIWGQVDDGLFVQRAWNGDGEIIVRVDSLTNTHPWAKAGLMFRENLTATSPNVFVGLTPAAGAVFQARTASGGATSEPGHSWIPGAPSWLRLTRAGNTFTAAFSTNGTTWTPLGSQTLAMPAAVHVGFAVSSHATTSTTAAFSGLQLQ